MNNPFQKIKDRLHAALMRRVARALGAEHLLDAPSRAEYIAQELAQDGGGTTTNSITLHDYKFEKDQVVLTRAGNSVRCDFRVVLTADGDVLQHKDTFPCSEIPALLRLLRSDDDEEEYIVRSSAQTNLLLENSEEGVFLGFELLCDNDESWGVNLGRSGIIALAKFLEQPLGEAPDDDNDEDRQATEDLMPRIGL